MLIAALETPLIHPRRPRIGRRCALRVYAARGVLARSADRSADAGMGRQYGEPAASGSDEGAAHELFSRRDRQSDGGGRWRRGSLHSQRLVAAGRSWLGRAPGLPRPRLGPKSVWPCWILLSAASISIAFTLSAASRTAPRAGSWSSSACAKKGSCARTSSRGACGGPPSNAQFSPPNTRRGMLEV